MTLATISTAALVVTTAVYAVLGALFAGRGEYKSAAALYCLALLAFLGALA